MKGKSISAFVLRRIELYRRVFPFEPFCQHKHQGILIPIMPFHSHMIPSNKNQKIIQ